MISLAISPSSDCVSILEHRNFINRLELSFDFTEFLHKSLYVTEFVNQNHPTFSIIFHILKILNRFLYIKLFIINSKILFDNYSLDKLFLKSLNSNNANLVPLPTSECLLYELVKLGQVERSQQKARGPHFETAQALRCTLVIHYHEQLLLNISFLNLLRCVYAL